MSITAANVEIRQGLTALAQRRLNNPDERALARLEAELEDLLLAGHKRIPWSYTFPSDLPANHGITAGSSIKHAIARIFDELMEQPLAGWHERMAPPFAYRAEEWLPVRVTHRIVNRGHACTECATPAVCKGLCPRHYMRRRRAEAPR